MKTYIETAYQSGAYIEVPVNVPTPKELQAVTRNADYSVVISNFTFAGREQHFAVANFDKETDEVLIKMGFPFKLKAKDVYTFKGKDARKLAIETAKNMLIGRY